MSYQRIAQAIAYLQHHYQQQPPLDEVAEHIHLSPYHFQRLFTEWAGVSPKKFLQYISLHHAKTMLRQSATLLNVSESIGLSSPSRLHDLFINIEGMTPYEYKNGGENLTIDYEWADSPFGPLLIASTTKGICFLAFADHAESALTELRQQFPQAKLQQQTTVLQQQALLFFQQQELPQLKLHLKASDFQLKVWEALLKIPLGQLTTYSGIAQSIQQPQAARAVGSAIASNPVAFLIPCHRVIQKSGVLGNYRWGETRKVALVGWEAAQTQSALT